MEKSNPTANSEWCVKRFIGNYILQSHTMTDMSYEAEARTLAWYGENFMRLTASWWSVRVIMGTSVVARKSQTLIMLSVDAVAMKFSYLLKSMLRTSFEWA